MVDRIVCSCVRCRDVVLVAYDVTDRRYREAVQRGKIVCWSCGAEQSFVVGPPPYETDARVVRAS